MSKRAVVEFGHVTVMVMYGFEPLSNMGTFPPGSGQR